MAVMHPEQATPSRVSISAVVAVATSVLAVLFVLSAVPVMLVQYLF